jgi:signal transduction histidine kinase
MKLSLRKRFFIGMISGMLFLLGIFGVVVYTMVHNALLRQFDNALLQTAELLTAAAEENQDNEQGENVDEQKKQDETNSPSSKREIEFELNIRMTSEFHRDQSSGYYQLWDMHNAILAKSPSLGNHSLPYQNPSTDAPLYHKIKFSDHTVRVIYLRFLPNRENTESIQSPPEKQYLTLAVARDASALYNQLDRLRWILAAAAAGGLFLSLTLTVVAVLFSLRPIRLLAEDIAGIRENTLYQRLDTNRFPKELLPVCGRLNDLLERLENSFERERRFNADVAHELRTPLAGLRSIFDVTLSRPREAADYKTSMEKSLTITESIQKMIESLLLLRQLDNTNHIPDRKTVNLKNMVQECWQFHADCAEKRNLTLSDSLAGELSCTTNEVYLKMIMNNLLKNAVDYCDEGGHIRITGKKRDDRIHLSISNTGCRLTTDQLDHIWEPFWRGDKARSDTGTHCGLGMTLVWKFVGVLGGEISLNITPEKLFVVSLVLPA